MDISGAIFDLDGTLLETTTMWSTVGSRFLESCGIFAQPDLQSRLGPMTLEGAAQHFIDEYAVRLTVEEILAEMYRIVESGYVESASLKPGVTVCLDRLKDAGIPMAIATASGKSLVGPVLERLGVSHYFEGIITCSEVGVSKQQPDVFLRAREIVGSPLHSTVVFEDSLHAIETAKRAGFKVVGVHDTMSAAHTTEIQAIADWYVESLADWEMLP